MTVGHLLSILSEDKKEVKVEEKVKRDRGLLGEKDEVTVEKKVEEKSD